VGFLLITVTGSEPNHLLDSEPNHLLNSEPNHSLDSEPNHLLDSETNLILTIPYTWPHLGIKQSVCKSVIKKD
jgi:hypothetical protein